MVLNVIGKNFVSWQEHKLVKEHILEKDSIFLCQILYKTLHTE